MSVDPPHDSDLIRDTANWPLMLWLPVRRSIGAEGEVQTGFIYDLDVIADEQIRVFESTPETEQALMGRTLIEGGQLAVIERYDSLEAMLDDGWSVD